MASGTGKNAEDVMPATPSLAPVEPCMPAPVKFQDLPGCHRWLQTGRTAVVSPGWRKSLYETGAVCHMTMVKHEKIGQYALSPGRCPMAQTPATWERNAKSPRREAQALSCPAGGHEDLWICYGPLACSTWDSRRKQRLHGGRTRTSNEPHPIRRSVNRLRCQHRGRKGT